MGVGGPVCFGVRARAAAVIERWPALRAALVELAPQCEAEQIDASEGMRDGATIVDGPCGLPRASTLVGQPTEVSLRPPAPVSHLRAAVNGRAEVCTLRSMLGRASLPGQARLRSCVGLTAGHLFTARAIAVDDPLAFDDEPFAAEVRWSVGMQ